MKLRINLCLILLFCMVLCACGKPPVMPPEYFQTYTPPVISDQGHAFEFKPDAAHKNLRHDRWTRMAEAEAANPSFSGPVLHMDDEQLVKDWRALYNFLAEADRPTQLRYVNSFFNKFPFKDDDTNWGGPYWSTPQEFLDKNGGDCEDYSIAKFYALKALGVPVSDMFVVVVGYQQKEGAHAILLVIDGDDFYILDNLKKDVVYINGTDKAFYPQYYLSEGLLKFHR